MCLLLAGLILPANGWAQVWEVGLSAEGRVIEAVASDAAPDTGTDLRTVLVVGGLDGGPGPSGTVSRLLEAHRAGEFGENIRLVAIPMANPDSSPVAFPPTGVAYRENREAHALWRWIGVHAPDLVLVAGDADYGLVQALSDEPAAGVGRIPALGLTEVSAAAIEEAARSLVPSEARREISRRRARTASELAAELAEVYGHDFDQLTYIPGMALIGRLRLGEVEDVGALAAPYLDELPTIRSSLNIAGHLVFAELADRTADERYLALVRRAADLAFDDAGEMLEAMPLHGEMSDAFFMAAPLLARAGELTGDSRYYDMAARHLEFMSSLVLRADGLYRHSPLTDAAWSRGNAFPALGLALTLSSFPRDHPAFRSLRGSFEQHMARLLEFQDADGMWHQVIDHWGSYAELSSTAMIATAMLRGIRSGWIDSEQFEAAVARAWRGVLTRTGSDGALIDVCESTNKQDSLEAYLNRMAILGPDARGGGMILFFATEMAGLE